MTNIKCNGETLETKIRKDCLILLFLLLIFNHVLEVPTKAIRKRTSKYVYWKGRGRTIIISKDVTVYLIKRMNRKAEN